MIHTNISNKVALAHAARCNYFRLLHDTLELVAQNFVVSQVPYSVTRSLLSAEVTLVIETGA